LAALEPQDIVRHVSRARARAQLDRALGEKLSQRRTGGVAEDPQRLALGGDERDRRIGDAPEFGGGHDRELVRGQRPGGFGRHDDGHTATMSAPDLCDHPLDVRDVGRPAERE
jgi:hypothetical protein